MSRLVTLEHKPTQVQAIRYDGTVDCLREINDTIVPAGCRLAFDITFESGTITRRDGNSYRFFIDDYIIVQPTGCIYTVSSASLSLHYQEVPA